VSHTPHVVVTASNGDIYVLDGGGGVVLLSLIDVFELLFVLLLPPLSK
jgi:hypothetical protein